MLAKLSKVGLLAVSAIYSFHTLFFWMFESTDSLFYYTFSDFLRTGKYFMPHPYYYTTPSTMEPPLYSVFLFLVGFFPRADIIIHLLQLGALLGSSYFIYKIISYYFKKELGLIAASIFALTPAHFIYSANLVAEPIAIFFITFYLFLIHKIQNEKGTFLIPWLFVLSSIMLLQRYNLIVFYLFTILFLLIKFFPISLLAQRNREERKGSRAGFLVFLASDTAVDPPHPGFPHAYPSARKTTKTLQRQIRNDLFGFGISIVIIFTWVFINHNLNGSWGLSNAEGKHLYNRILHFDKLLPANDNPTFQKFKAIVGEGKDYLKPWWFYEEALMASLGSETKASNFMGEVAIEALKTNPAKYIFDFIPFFIFAHHDNPTYHDKLYLWEEGQSKSCRTLGTISFCKPAVSWDFSRKIWDTAVKIIDNYYLNLDKYLNFFLFFPALFWSIFQKDRFVKFVSLLYVSSILFFVAFEAPLPRYTYIFTPLKTILTDFFLFRLAQFVIARSKATKQSL